MSSISSVSSSNSWMQAQMKIRPSSAQQTKLAEDAFSKIDTGGKGSFDIAGLTSAVNTALSGNQTKTSFSSSDVQTVFSKMDSDSDGKVTQQEFTSTLSQLQGHPNQANNSSDQSYASSGQSHGMNMQGPGGMHAMGGMPPPPPPSGGGGGGQSTDDGFTEDELTTQLKAISSFDSENSTLISNVLNNFSAADVDGNGKVSRAEAMKLDESLSTNGNRSSGASTSLSSATSASAQYTGTTSNSSNTAEQIQQRLMRQMMKMMEAYSMDNLSMSANSTASQLSVTA